MTPTKDYIFSVDVPTSIFSGIIYAKNAEEAFQKALRGDFVGPAAGRPIKCRRQDIKLRMGTVPIMKRGLEGKTPVAKRIKGKTWRRANPRDVLASIIAENPKAGERKLLLLFIEHIRGRDGKGALDSVAKYWFAQNLGRIEHQVHQQRIGNQP